MAKWFYSQNRLLQCIVLILPVIGWIFELIIRWSSFLETKSLWNLIWAILFTFVGWGVVLEILDIIWLCLVGHLIGAKA